MSTHLVTINLTESTIRHIDEQARLVGSTREAHVLNLLQRHTDKLKNDAIVEAEPTTTPAPERSAVSYFREAMHGSRTLMGLLMLAELLADETEHLDTQLRALGAVPNYRYDAHRILPDGEVLKPGADDDE